MVESLGGFPFRKLINDKYLILDVMMFVDHQQILKFMYTCNKKTRAFLYNNYLTIRNGFINDGLIPFYFDIHPEKQFYHY
jgi:hypothetical protein